MANMPRQNHHPRRVVRDDGEIFPDAGTLADSLGVSATYLQKQMRVGSPVQGRHYDYEKTTAPKGHWPAGKRRHERLSNWDSLRKDLIAVAKLRRSRVLAKKIGVHVDTLRKWRKDIDVPSPIHAAKLLSHIAKATA